MLEKVGKKIRKEISSNKITYLLLLVVLIGAFFVRIYRTEDLLRFYYDQGRDALVIWRFWHEGKFFLIGPITGLSGIFLGPFYYYLIAPFYLLGGGNPVYPSVFLTFLSVCSLGMLYILGKEMHSRNSGVIAATIGAFSYFIVQHGRWLSNPNPILLSSMILIYAMWRVTQKGNGKWWMVVAFMVGLSLQFESASAVFYIPTVFVYWVWVKLRVKREGAFKDVGVNLFFPFIVFLGTLIPQILFNFRHDNILFNNFSKLFFQEKAFRGITAFVLRQRLEYFASVFMTKLFPGVNKYRQVFVALSFASLVVAGNKLKKNLISLFVIFFTVPALGYIFFQGNYGNIYDYYLSGYYLPLILIFSIGLAESFKTVVGKVAVLVFFVMFFHTNIELLKNYLTATPASRPIALEDQLQAVNWVFDDVKNVECEDECKFNTDVYVPPVIPHAYDYLFLWKGYSQCGNDLCGKVEKQMPLLYTLYEEDPPHPERLEAWLERQKGLGVVEKEQKFGQITIQRRKRI